MDADIYGPSVPIMMGIACPLDQATTPFPIEKYGLKLMSMGFVVPPDAGGHLARPDGRPRHHAVPHRTATGGRSTTSIIDLPPGTGDAQLTLTQQTPR